MNSVWTSAALWCGAYAIVAIAIGLFLGLEWGLLTLSVLLLSAWLYQLRHLSRIVTWAAQPAGTQPPDAGGEWGLLCAHLTKRVRTANSLREELSRRLERFRETWEVLPDGVVTLGAGHVIEGFNSAAAQYFSLKPGTDVGAPFSNLVRRPELQALLNSQGAQEPIFLEGVRQSDPLLSVQVISFGMGQKLVLARDITHLVKLERMRSDFVANVSHELKTPLTVVSGFVETLLDFQDDLPTEEKRNYLNLIMEQSHRMQHLVEDLLTLAALETDAPPAHEEHLDVAEFVGNVLREAEALSGGRHLISVDSGPEVHILGSEREVRSALANLASNAVRYTPTGGMITISWFQAEDKGVSIAVADTGIGIAAEHLPRLTERFYRVDRGRSRGNGGTGLGLAIVKHVMTRHQGDLAVSSTPDRGSRFTMHFPPERTVVLGKH